LKIKELKEGRFDELRRAKAKRSDGTNADILKEGAICISNKTVDEFTEKGFKNEMKILIDNLIDHLKGEGNDLTLLIRGGNSKDTQNAFPSRFDVLGTREDHLRETVDDQFTNLNDGM